MFSANYKLTTKELLTSINTHQKKSRTIAKWCLMLLILFFAIQQYFENGVIVAFILAMPLLLLFVIVWKVAAYQMESNVRKNPHLGEHITFTFDEEGIQAEGESFFWTLAWKGIIQIVSTPQGLLLYPQPQIFYWIPRDAIVEEYDQFNAFLKKKVRRYKSLS
jgi:hypothetical protein